MELEKGGLQRALSEVQYVAVRSEHHAHRTRRSRRSRSRFVGFFQMQSEARPRGEEGSLAGLVDLVAL